MKKEEQVVQWLRQKQWHISFAESCTGGLVAARLVDVANASSVFDVSYITYANDAKKELLGVESQTIATCGVVSEEVAREMAQGVSQRTGAEVAVGVSGIAGPSGGTGKKPVGMVCFGFVIGDELVSFTKQFGEIGRNQVREKSVEFVYDVLYRYAVGECV